MTKPRDYGVSIRITSPDLRQAARQLEAARGDMLPLVGAKLATTGPDLTAKVRAGIDRIPSWNLYGTNLRSRLSANVEARPFTGAGQVGIRVQINPVGLPPGLPAAMDSNRKRLVPGHGVTYAFRHPVFGREHWANQATYPYFSAVLRRQRKVTDVAVQQAVDEVLAKIADI